MIPNIIKDGSYKKLAYRLPQLLSSSITKNFFIYAIGSILLRGLAVVLMPFLSPTDFGLFSMIMNFNNFLVIFSSFGLRQLFYLEYYHCDTRKRIIMINNIIIIYLILSLPLFGILFYGRDIINAYFFAHSLDAACMLIMLLYCFMHFFAELFYQVLQYQSKAIRLTVLKMSIAMATIMLSLIFLYLFQWGVYGMMLGFMCGMFVVCVIGLQAYIKKSCFSLFDVRHALSNFSYYLKFGLPFIPGVLFGWMLAFGDRWVLARYGTLHDVGIYSCADMFGSVFYMLVLYPMSGSYLPYLFEKFAQNKDNLAHVEYDNRKVMYISMVVTTVLITLGYLVCKPLIYWILPMKYHEAIKYIWLILIGQVFLMGSYFASAYIQFHKKTYALVLALCVPAVLNMVLNMIFVARFGIYGCVMATVISYACYFFITLLYNNKLLRRHQKGS